MILPPSAVQATKRDQDLFQEGRDVQEEGRDVQEEGRDVQEEGRGVQEEAVEVVMGFGSSGAGYYKTDIFSEYITSAYRIITLARGWPR